MEMVSDEVCYNRMRVFDNCNNGKKTRELENLIYFVENEQQAETIINSCKLKKQEILKEEINKLRINEETNKEETNKEVVNINNETLNAMLESL